MPPKQDSALLQNVGYVNDEVTLHDKKKCICQTSGKKRKNLQELEFTYFCRSKGFHPTCFCSPKDCNHLVDPADTCVFQFLIVGVVAKESFSFGKVLVTSIFREARNLHQL